MLNYTVGTGMRSQHTELAIGRRLPASIPAEAKSPDRFLVNQRSYSVGPWRFFDGEMATGV
jgi:hypothetical protein